MKIKSLSIIAAAITATICAEVASGKRKLLVGERELVGLTKGPSGFIATGNDAVWAIGADGVVSACYTDPNADITGLKLNEQVTAESDALAFDFGTFKAGGFAAVTRAGRDVSLLVDAGASAPEFSRLIGHFKHPKGYTIPFTVSLEGKVYSGDKTHAQDLFLVPDIGAAHPVATLGTASDVAAAAI